MIKLWTIKFYNTGPWAGCAGQYSVNLSQMPEVDTPKAFILARTDIVHLVDCTLNIAVLKKEPGEYDGK
jgi:hypothetical protein